MIDVYGKLILEQETVNSQTLSLNVSKLSSKTYFLKIQINNAIRIKKVTK
ncbi:T9SS type A sorting domain-containing protein [uncultured Kordia sp.]